MSGLVTFFESHQGENLGCDPLREATDAFFNGEERGGALLFSLASHCKHFSLCTQEDFIEYYRSLLSLLFLRKFCEIQDEKLDNQIRVLILKGRTKGFGKQLSLQKGYEALATLLFENKITAFDFKQLEKGAILSNQLPHPLQSGEMGLIALYLGLIGKDEELLYKGLKCAEFSLSLCDTQGNLFTGFWIKESDYHGDRHKETFALLFKIASNLTQSSKLQTVTQSFSEKGYSDPFIQLLNHAFKEKSFSKLSHGLTLQDVDRSLGFMRYQCGETCLVCSAAGSNTGISSLHKKGIHIASMGPHYAPLADSDYYGIFRLSNGSQEGFKDLRIKSDEDKGKFQGWTRVKPPNLEEQGNQWLYVDLEVDKEKVDLTVRKSDQNESTPLFYVFFVSADKGRVENEVELFPGMIDRYQGSAKKVLFERGKENIEITPFFESEMKLIPLAGKNHFWSADFLLAFSLKKKLCPYRWTIN